LAMGKDKSGIRVVMVWQSVPGKPSAQWVRLWDKLLAETEKGGDESRDTLPVEPSQASIDKRQ
jgi:hypothetical protein